MTKHEAHAGHGEHGHDSGPLGERSELIFSLACTALTGTGWALGRFDVQANTSTALFVIAYVLGAWFSLKFLLIHDTTQSPGLATILWARGRIKNDC